MKKIGLALAALFLCVVWTASALAASVTVTGHGATERDALHAAMREAIEQQVGVLVDSQTYVENYRVIHDRIYTHSEGYIAGYDILRSEYKAGYYEVTIRANVREELLNTDLMSYMQKKAVIRANMQDPRIGVIIVDQHGTEYPSVENTIIKGLHKNGFSRIVDLTQIDASVKHRIANAVFDGDSSLNGILGSHFNVDYLVTGYLNMNADGVPLIDDYPFVGSLNNVAVNLSVRMLNANTGEILYAGSADGQSFNLGPKALQEALRKAEIGNPKSRKSRAACDAPRHRRRARHHERGLRAHQCYPRRIRRLHACETGGRHADRRGLSRHGARSRTGIGARRRHHPRNDFRIHPDIITSYML